MPLVGLKAGMLAHVRTVLVEYFFVAGGGNGAAGGAGLHGGGGGAGGLLQGSLTLRVGVTYTLQPGLTHQNSTFSGLLAPTLVCIAGGNGAQASSKAGDGGSGGGAPIAGNQGHGTVGQGWDGSSNNTAAGGGSAAPGGQHGGTPSTTNFSGTTLDYAGGGSGGLGSTGADTGNNGNGGGVSGGTGGGVVGGVVQNGTAGVRGGGGGGGGYLSTTGAAGQGGAGGAGIMMIRYINNLIPRGTGGTIVNTIIGQGLYTIHTFNATGSAQPFILTQ